MPFVSREQVKACYAKKSAGDNGSWNCNEWAAATPSIKNLPKRKMAKGATVGLGLRHRGPEYGGLVR